MDVAPQHHRIVIIGTGFAGLGAAIRLKQEGERDFVLLERSDEVGGVWRDNTYPGIACDVQSHLYSFSFAPNPSWSQAYSPGQEIFEYLRDCATRFGIRPHVRFGHTVERAAWDDEQRRWRIETSRGPFTADFLVAANGALSEPSIPEVPGLASFQGEAFHSANWRHDVELRGKRVAVIGTGASAIQFVPAIQPKVERLHLFQRTAAWVLPRTNTTIPASLRALYASVPAAQKLVRGAIYAFREGMLFAFRDGPMSRMAEALGRRYLEKTVRDPALRKKLTPEFRIGCKRILLSDEYLPALTRPNVEVVTDAIREVRARSIVTSDGEERAVDVILFGTGFKITDQPIAHMVRGRTGQTLAEAWRGSPRAHLGTMIAGFPNFFLMQGPNTGLGHTSVVIMMEAQIEHMLLALKRLPDCAQLEPRAEVQAKFVDEVDRAMRGSVWTAGGCQSWYLDATGRNSTLWPGHTFTFRRLLGRFDPSDYLITLRPKRPSAAYESAARSP